VLWGQDNVFDDRKLDFDEGTKMRIVDVIWLPPGDDELYNFRPVSQAFYVGFRKTRRAFKSKEDFSLPFTIRPCAGTYIGELLAVGIKGQDKTPSGGNSCCRTWQTATSRLRSASSRRCPKSPLPPLPTWRSLTIR
jgi:hypothetical protein